MNGLLLMSSYSSYYLLFSYCSYSAYKSINQCKMSIVAVFYKRPETVKLNNWPAIGNFKELTTFIKKRNSRIIDSFCYC